MLTLFEEITSDLTDYEKDVVLPEIVRNFKLKKNKREVGSKHAVKNAQICNGINRRLNLDGSQYILKEVKLRKIMGVIRQAGYVMHLCSSSRGYYVAENLDELNECINSLEQRIRQQQRVVDALKKQSAINELA